MCALFTAPAESIPFKTPVPAESKPLIVTSSPTLNPWSGESTVIVVLPESVKIGFADNNSSGTGAFSKVAKPPAVVNSALNIVNARSLVWSGSHVVPFCDLNKLPNDGCLLILLSVLPNSNA